LVSKIFVEYNFVESCHHMLELTDYSIPVLKDVIELFANGRGTIMQSFVVNDLKNIFHALSISL